VGLLGSAQALLASAAALARTRLALFGTELHEQLARLFGALLCAIGALILSVLGIAYLGLALVISLDEESRALASSIIGLVLLAVAGAAAWGMGRFLRSGARAFDASLTELERDYEALRP
jgi:uncharacterized membrane protein YqjE